MKPTNADPCADFNTYMVQVREDLFDRVVLSIEFRHLSEAAARTHLKRIGQRLVDGVYELEERAAT